MSLGNCLHKKSISFTAWRRLAPPRDIFRIQSRPVSTLPIPPVQAQSSYCSDDRASAPTLQHGIDKELYLRELTNGWINGVRGNDTRQVAPKRPSSDAAVGKHSGGNKHSQSSNAEKPVRFRKIIRTIGPSSPTAAGLSKSQYERWKSAVEKSQVNKTDKARRQDELNALTTVDWRQGPAAQWDKSLRIMETQENTPDGEQALIKFTYWGNKKEPTTHVRADSIPQPSKWSVVSFKRHVEDLTKSTMSPLRQREKYQVEESHEIAVAEQLRLLFGNIRLENHWSVEACNTALVFFYKHAMQHKARQLYSQMEDRKYLTSTETFNIMLRGSASRKNTAQFRGLLDAMIKRNLEPNAETWEAFFVVSQSSDQQFQIFQSMRDQGALNNLRRMSSFLSLNIRQIFRQQLDMGRTVAWLLEYMDKLESFQWLSTSVGNILIDEVGKRGSVKDALDLFDQLEARGMQTDNVTLNTLIHKCFALRNHDTAVYALKRLRRHEIYPDKVAYTSLFRQLWRTKAYNAGKVVWRYACVEGQATSKMRNIVSQSIKHELRDTPQLLNRNDIWTAYAGRVVVGVELGLPLNDALQTLLRSGQGSILDKNSTGNHLMERDLASAHRYAIKRSLPDLLEEALAIDRQWANEHVWRHKGLVWMLQNSIDVVLEHTFPGRFFPPSKRPAEYYSPESDTKGELPEPH